jgi:hypothetical protein
MALALVGLAVGTATGATTPFQQVVVVNAPASPIPVTGTVSVGNTPANQDVTVTNLPETQPVSGTVSVSGLPASKATVVFSKRDSIGNEEANDYAFGRTINVSTLILEAFDSDDFEISLVTVGGGRVEIWSGTGDHESDFTLPVPATGIHLYCFNIFLDCHATVAAFGT